MCVVKSKDKMTTDRFHKAARDGLVEVLKEATRKDMNARDNEKMTPVMWAAFEGRLDALRLLCGRGGDPDKCDQFGNTALHLAAAKGHLACVDFLTKFGVNIYALDIDKHSAKDLAAINNKDEILRYLDAAAAKFEAHDKKKAKALKEIAEKNCEKRIREYIKQQRREEHEHGDVRPSTSGKSSKVLSSLKQKIWSSQGNLNKSYNDAAPIQQCSVKSCNKFSDLVASGGSSGSSTIASRTNTMQKAQHQCSHSGAGVSTASANSGFKIGEVEADGKRTVTSLTGLQRDSEVLYVGTFSSTEDGGKRGKISDVFEMDEPSNNCVQDANKLAYGALSRSFSQPDILGDSQASDDFSETSMLNRPNRLFERPTMLGSIAFRRSVTAALSQLQPNADAFGSDDLFNSTGRMTYSGSGSRSKTRTQGSKLRLCLNLSDDSDSDGRDEEVYSEDDDESKLCTPLQRFLAVWSLDEYYPVFQQQEIDLSTLMLLTESDLKSLGLPLGPFRKLTFAIQERRNALENPGPMVDSRL